MEHIPFMSIDVWNNIVQYLEEGHLNMKSRWYSLLFVNKEMNRIVQNSDPWKALAMKRRICFQLPSAEFLRSNQGYKAFKFVTVTLEEILTNGPQYGDRYMALLEIAKWVLPASSVNIECPQVAELVSDLNRILTLVKDPKTLQDNLLREELFNLIEARKPYITTAIVSGSQQNEFLKIEVSLANTCFDQFKRDQSMMGHHILGIVAHWDRSRFLNPADYADDPDIAISLIQKTNMEFKNVSDRLREDREFVKRVLYHAPMVILELSEQDKGNLEYATIAITSRHNTNYMYLQELPTQIVLNRGLMKKALYRDYRSILYMHPDVRNDINIVMYAVHITGSSLAFLPEEMKLNREVILEAVRTTPSAIKYVPEAMHEDVFRHIQQEST